MNKIIFFLSSVFFVLFLCCSTAYKSIDSNDLAAISNIFVDTYDEKGQISIFVPPELSGAGYWGSTFTITMVNFNNETLEEAVNQVLAEWNFENVLYKKVVSSLNENCGHFNIINGATKLTKESKTLISKEPMIIDINSELYKELNEKSVDALLLLKPSYYGPFTRNAFASCRMRCDVDVQLISIPNWTVIWNRSISLKKLKSNEILFNLTMYEYLEKDCLYLKKSLEKAAEVISKEISSAICSEH